MTRSTANVLPPAVVEWVLTRLPLRKEARTAWQAAEAAGLPDRMLVAFGFSCPRIPRFSNPDQFHHGFRRGVALSLPISADNASMFNLTARVVANYRHALVQP